MLIQKDNIKGLLMQGNNGRGAVVTKDVSPFSFLWEPVKVVKFRT